jgi:hypothetical protein
LEDDEYEECKSEHLYSSSSEDEERDEREFMQGLKHMIRLEVEKKVFSLIE